MINLKKQDPIADAVKEILQQEALKGNQHKIDKNKNNKIDAEDFKLLRKEENVDEALKGNQHKIDKNKNNKIDAEDFKILRKEETVEEGIKDIAKKAFKALTGGSDEDQLKNLQKKMGLPQTGKKPEPQKEEVEIEEGLQQTLRKVVPGYAKREIDKKMDAGKFGKTDADKDANFHRYKKIQDKLKKEEVEQIEEDTMTHITLGKKVKNDDGGHDQEVHYKGKKIGHIESYKHRTGLRYGGVHHATGDMEAGSRSPEEAINFIRSSHAEHLKSMKEEVEQIDELSKSTLGSYVKNAAKDVGASRKLGADFANNAKKSKNPSSKSANSRLSDRFNSIAQKRHAGIGKAVERLTKEEEVVPKTLKQFKENAFDWKKKPEPTPNGGSGVKQGSRYGGSKQKDVPEKDTDEKK